MCMLLRVNTLYLWMKSFFYFFQLNELTTDFLMIKFDPGAHKFYNWKNKYAGLFYAHFKHQGRRERVQCWVQVEKTGTFSKRFIKLGFRYKVLWDLRAAPVTIQWHYNISTIQKIWFFMIDVKCYYDRG